MGHLDFRYEELDAAGEHQWFLPEEKGSAAE
jgi:hypothetical protein